MSNSHQSLPRFRKPPVVETVLGVYFRPLEQFSLAQLGIFWDRYFREQFPKIEERPPVEEITEQFGEGRLATFPMVRWQMMDRPDVPRLWAVSECGQHVVQVQRNAFFSNWLKSADSASYQPYSERRHQFAIQLSQLEKFFLEQKIGNIQFTSWNVTYINHIDYGGIDHLGSEVAKMLTVWTNQINDDFLGEPDKLALSFAYPLPDDSGRLNINIAPATLPRDKCQVLRLDMTARGQLKTKDIDAALSAIDLGHEWVVRGFTSLTRPEMHHIWEREQ